MKIVYQNVVYLLMFATYNYLCLANNEITVGVLFNDENSQAEIAFRSLIYKINSYNRLFLHFRVVAETVSRTDSYAAFKLLCNMTETEELAAIFGPSSLTTSAIIESICESMEIPHIQVNWRPSPPQIPIPDPNIERLETVLNLYPNPDLFAEGLAVIVKNLHWRNFVILYENDDGLIRLQEVLKLQEYDDNDKTNDIVVRQLGSGPDYRQLLKEIKNSSIARIILDCKAENILNILQQAKHVDLLKSSNSYFLTSVDAHTVNLSSLESAANITTIKLFNITSRDFLNEIRNWEQYEYNNGRPIILAPEMIKTETVLLYDALFLYLESLMALYEIQPIEPRKISCQTNGTAEEFGITKATFEDGARIISHMRVKQLTRMPLSGPVEFPAEGGGRINFTIYVSDLLQELGTWNPKEPSKLGFAKSQDEMYTIMRKKLSKNILRVSSKIGEPYLRKRKPKDETEILEGNDRYEGYSVDLILHVCKESNLTCRFEFDEKQAWKGIIDSILNGEADLGICDLTINHERRKLVDFSLPFMNLGIAILYKKAEKEEVDSFAFLDPFSNEVWFYTATLYLAISVMLYFISRMAQGDWEKPHPCEENPEELENIWDLKNCLWLTLGSIMTQGCDILPKGLASRMTTTMWWFFSLIMTSSYTANLAAFLTKDKQATTINSVEDLVSQSKIKYGVVKGGATESFFKNSNETMIKKMYTNMIQTKPNVFQKANEDGVKRVESDKNGLYAFLLESTAIEYETETHCKLKQVGNWLDSKTYGIAMPMNSPYRGIINEVLLKFQENGKLAELKDKWWKKMRDKTPCDQMRTDSGNSNKLSLGNVGGVFWVLGIGVSISFILGIVEFLWNIRNVSVEEHLTYWEALKVEVKFALNIWVTKKSAKPTVSESSSSSSTTGSRNRDSKSISHSILQKFS